MTLVEIASACAGSLGLGGGFWVWLASRPRGRADIQTSQAAFQTALNSQVEAFTASLMELTERQRATIAKLESRVADLEDDKLRAHGVSRELRQIIRSLVHRLKAAGIDLPDDLDVAAILETDDDGVSTMEAVSFRSRPKTA